VVEVVSSVFLFNQALLSNALEIQAQHASVGAARSWVASACTKPESPVPYIPEYFCFKFSLLFPVQPFLLQNLEGNTT